MLEHLGEPAAARRLMEAIETVTASGPRTADLGGNATTVEVTRAVCEAIGSSSEVQRLRGAEIQRFRGSEV